MYTPKQPDEYVNLPKENMLLQAFKLFISIGLFTLVIYLLLMISSKLIINHITPEQEKKLIMMSAWSKIHKVKSDIYLQSIVNKFKPCIDLPYRINIGYISLDGQVNALALPGGTIGITKEMYNAVQNENELAFIIGHELAHFENKDHLQGLGNGLVLGMISLFLGEEYGDLFSYSLKFTQSKFSQKIEKEADTYSLDLMQCAYGNVNYTSTLFKRMDDGDHWSYFLATHPHFDERIETMQAYIQKEDFKIKGEAIPLP